MRSANGGLHGSGGAREVVPSHDGEEQATTHYGGRAAGGVDASTMFDDKTQVNPTPGVDEQDEPPDTFDDATLVRHPPSAADPPIPLLLTNRRRTSASSYPPALLSPLPPPPSPSRPPSASRPPMQPVSRPPVQPSVRPSSPSRAPSSPAIGAAPARRTIPPQPPEAYAQQAQAQAQVAAQAPAQVSPMAQARAAPTMIAERRREGAGMVRSVLIGFACILLAAALGLGLGRLAAQQQEAVRAPGPPASSGR